MMNCSFFFGVRTKFLNINLTIFGFKGLKTMNTMEIALKFSFVTEVVIQNKIVCMMWSAENHTNHMKD
jgi:hypothetical protein